MNSANQIITGRIASAHEAILNPLDYELHFNSFGWQLSYVGDSMATMITDTQALNIIKCMEVANLMEKTKHDIAEESEYQQSLLDQEAGDDIQGSPEAMDGHILEVLKSNAGWYIGTTKDMMPNSRDSVEYWPTQAMAQAALNTNSFTRREHP